MALRCILRKWKTHRLTSSFLTQFTSKPTKTINIIRDISSALSSIHFITSFEHKNVTGFREYHDGRPRGPLWRGKKLIGKEALYVISGLKRFKDDEEKLIKFIKTHVLRLLKMDLIAVLTELERQQEVSLALKVSFHSLSLYHCYPFVFMFAACNMFVVMLLRNLFVYCYVGSI